MKDTTSTEQEFAAVASFRPALIKKRNEFKLVLPIIAGATNTLGMIGRLHGGLLPYGSTQAAEEFDHYDFSEVEL
jgi:hypothetical protein